MRPSPGGWRAGWGPRGPRELEGMSVSLYLCGPGSPCDPAHIHGHDRTWEGVRLCVHLCGCSGLCECALACLQTCVPVGVSVPVRAMLCKCVHIRSCVGTPVCTSGCKCERVHLFGNRVYRPGLVCGSVCVSVSVCVCVGLLCVNTHDYKHERVCR